MKRILILISNGSESLEISPFIDVFGWNNIVNKNKIEVLTSSLQGEISCTWNLKIKTELNLSIDKIDISNFDVLIVPGGFGFKGYFDDLENEKFINIIREFFKQKKLIVGVCTGAIALGKAGILENKLATTYLFDNDRYFNQLTKYKAIAKRENFVQDDNIITVSAPKNAINVAFYLIQILLGKDSLDNVKFNMGF